jgi:hypothetical protein
MPYYMAKVVNRIFKELTLEQLEGQPGILQEGERFVDKTHMGLSRGRNTTTSFRYTKQVFHLTPGRILSMARWNVPGALRGANFRRRNRYIL